MTSLVEAQQILNAEPVITIYSDEKSLQEKVTINIDLPYKCKSRQEPLEIVTC